MKSNSTSSKKLSLTYPDGGVNLFSPQKFDSFSSNLVFLTIFLETNL